MSVTRLRVVGGSDMSLGLVEDSAPFLPADVLEVMDERTRALVERRHRTPRALRRGRLVHRALLAADACGIAVGLAVGFGPGALPWLATLPVWLVIAYLLGLYDHDQERAGHSTVDDLVGVVQLVTSGTWLLLIVSVIIGDRLGDSGLLTVWPASIVAVALARVLARAICRRSAAYLQNAVIFGAGDVGQLVARKLLNHPEYGINLVGFVDERPKIRRVDLPDGLSVLGAPDRLGEIVDALGIERVIVAFSMQPPRETLESLRRLSTIGVQVDVIPRLFQLMGTRAELHSVEGLPMLGLRPCRPAGGALAAKRVFDVVGAAAMLALTAPLFAAFAWRIRRDSPGPVFFRQARLGRHMREFTALKFRTMKVDTDPAQHEAYISQTMSADAVVNANGIYKLDRSDAVTKVGRWLRRTSLDELPQLINVLRGDMSLVGPRPCIAYEVDHFAPYQFERFLLPQGLTGLWQVTARGNSTFGEALDMDVAYVRGWTLGSDVKLLLRTPREILRQRRATA